MARLSFLPLLAQSLGVRLPGAVDEGTPPQFQNGIDVTSNRPTRPEDIETIAPRQQPSAKLDIPVDLSQVQGRQLSQEDYQRSLPFANLPEHKGAFGQKGTLRNILGVLGDAFLIQSGNKPMYGPRRQQEKLSDALLSMKPGQERDAIARAMAVDPEAGTALFKDWQGRMADEARLEATTKGRQATNQVQKIKLAQQWAANTQDPVVRSAIKAWIQDPDATLDDIPDELLGKAAIPAAKQQDIGIARDRLNQQKELELLKEKGRNKRDNPPTPPRPQQPTEASEIARIRGKVNRGEPLGKGDEATWKRHLEGTGRRRGSGRSGNIPAPVSSGGRRVIRQGNNLFDAETKKYIGPAN